MNTFGGPVLFLDRNDINTDEIIPAKYLTENTREALTPYLLEDLKLSGFDPKQDLAGKRVIVTRGNFGCGSSREHAPWALEMNGISIVIAESFARIFRQNMYNCGLIAAELPASELDALFADFAGKDASLAIPDVLSSSNSPTISVYIQLPGASVEAIAQSIATPLDKHLASLSGMNKMSSNVSFESCYCTIGFVSGTDLEQALRDTQTLMSRFVLPAGATTPVVQRITSTEVTLVFKAGDTQKTLSYVLKDFDRVLVEAGGWVEYAAGRY
jgi:3-isopropylmalate/(R)-2-methylmalate dehydratase small subunit